MRREEREERRRVERREEQQWFASIEVSQDLFISLNISIQIN